MSSPLRRFLDLVRTAHFAGCSPSTVLRWEKAGTFPRRRRLGPNRVAWDIRELEEWAAEREPVGAAPEARANSNSGAGR